MSHRKTPPTAAPEYGCFDVDGQGLICILRTSDATGNPSSGPTGPKGGGGMERDDVQPAGNNPEKDDPDNAEDEKARLTRVKRDNSGPGDGDAENDRDENAGRRYDKREFRADPVQPGNGQGHHWDRTPLPQTSLDSRVERGRELRPRPMSQIASLMY